MLPNLPSLGHDARAERELLAFERRELKLAGRSIVGGDVVVYDPLWSGVPHLPALIAHEATHDWLTTNTSFGYFTQLVHILAKRGLAGAAMAQCQHIQWMVQELAATYVEFATLAVDRPDLLGQEIDRLPAGRRGEPPYREAFDSINARLPLTATTDASTIKALSLLVRALALTAMSSDCLRRAVEVAPNEAGLLACMVDEPEKRLRRLLNGFDAAAIWRQLVEQTRTLAQDHGDRLRWRPIVDLLLAAMPRPVYVETDNLESLAKAIHARWSRTVGSWQFVKRDDNEGASLTFGWGAERAMEVLERTPPVVLPVGSIADFVHTAANHGQGFILELSVRDDLPQVAHVRLGAYLLEQPDAPWPSRGGPSDEAASSIPPDLVGLAALRTVAAELRGVRGLPRIVSMIDGSWRNVAKDPNRDVIFDSGIRLLRLCEISSDLIWQSLRFGDHGDRFILLRLSDQATLACILPPGEGRSFVVAMLTSEAAINLFASVCNNLGFQLVAEIGGLEREVGLLTMVGRF